MTSNGSKLTLTLGDRILSGQTISLDYTDPTEGVDDVDATQSYVWGIDAASLSNKSVSNLSTLTTPEFQSAITSEDGYKIFLSYDQILDYRTAINSSFDVKVNDAKVNVENVEVVGTDVVLTLEKPIKSTQTISLDYSDPDNSANDANVIQSIYGADADSLSNIEVTNDSILDGTPPSLEKILFPWPNVHGVVGVSAPGFDINVTDTESTIKELQITFASPDGTDEVKVDVDTSKTAHGSKNLPGSVAEYRNSWTIPESNQPGSIQGGFWKVKSVKVVDDSDNEGIYTRDDFPAAIKNAGFWVNNQPTRKQSIVGLKKIGQTLTINPDTIADPDIDNLPEGEFTPTYQYNWQVSDNGTDGWEDISSEANYTLTEADANKYFKSIVSYKGKDGIITETLESDAFKFTEFAVSPTPITESFETNNGGWTYADGSSVGTQSRASTNNYLGHLDLDDSVKKIYHLSNDAYKVSLDFLKFNSWDIPNRNAGPNGDTFSVQIDDQVLFTYRPNGDKYVSKHGNDVGYSWDLTSSTDGLTRNGVRYSVEIDLPNPTKEFTLQVNLDLDQTYTDEWGGIDNVKVYQEIPIAGAAAAPIFSSLQSASTVEKDGPGTVVYRAAADDQSRIIYSLEGGADKDRFSIDSATGDVHLLEDAHHETKSNYDFTVRATDVFGNFADKNVSLNIEDSSLAFWKEGGYRVDAINHKDSLPTANAVVLKDRGNRVLSDGINRFWNGLSVIKSNDGYRMLQIGERGRREGQYRIAELNTDGVLQSVGLWIDQDQAVADGYQELFEVDLNNDGKDHMPAAVDLDKDGFVDGLSHYRLIGNGKAFNLSDKRGKALTDKTSRFWNAITSKQVDDGFQVLIQGELGRRRSQYRVWTTDAEGKVTNKSSWLNGDTMAEQGFEEIFNRDFNNDKFVGEPTYSQSNDKNQDGLFDDLDYRLMGNSKTVNLSDQRGNKLTDKTSRWWNAVAPNRWAMALGSRTRRTRPPS